MALVMMPELVTRQISSLHPVVSAAAATLLGVAATFGPQFLRSPAIEIARREIGEFAFHNGALLPHQQYLYGVDHNGEPYIVGKKLVGQDYSAWEAEYKKFPRLESQTIEGPGSKVTYSWSSEAPKISTSQGILQILLWLAFGIFCALLLRYISHKVRNRNRFVRELHRKYKEQKSQILALSSRAVHYNETLWNLEKSAESEAKKTDAAKSALLQMKAEHAKELSEQQREIDRLQQMLDSTLGNSDHADAEGGKAESDNSQAPLDMDQPESSTDPITDHEDAAVEGGDCTAGATNTADEGQDEKSPAQAPLAMDQPESSTDQITDHEDAAVEGGDGIAGATNTADEGQDEKSPADDQEKLAPHKRIPPPAPSIPLSMQDLDCEQPEPKQEKVTRRKEKVHIRQTSQGWVEFDKDKEDEAKKLKVEDAAAAVQPEDPTQTEDNKSEKTADVPKLQEPSSDYVPKASTQASWQAYARSSAPISSFQLQPEDRKALDEQSAGLGDEDRASAAEQDDSFPTFEYPVAGLGDVDPRDAAHQADGPSTPDEQSSGPDLRRSERPLRQRLNKRSDGTVRTASHPGYVPLQEPQAQLGDRPFDSPGSGRRGRGQRGRGGSWGGRNGRGRGRGRFGWRGGRSERGWGGRGGSDGQYDQGRGQ